MSLSLTANEPESDPKRSEGGKRKENKCGLEPVQPSAIGSSLLSQTCLKVMKPILNKERMILPVPWKNDAAKIRRVLLELHCNSFSLLENTHE